MFRCCVPDFCSSPLIGLYLLCTACTAHRACSSFLLDKGKGTRKLSASQRGAARAAGECVPHAAALARLPVKTQEAARREPEQSGASAESAVTTHRGPGAQPRHAFGDFRRETKVTRVQGGAPAYRGSQGLPSRIKSPGCGAERPHRWVLGLPSRKKLPRGAEHGFTMLSRSARISWGAGALPAGATSRGSTSRGY